MNSDENTIQEDEVVAIFNRHRCPAELILPYKLEEPPTTFIRAFSRSRFKGPLWNMDSPWLKTMAFNGLVTVACAFIIAAFAYFMNKGDPGDLATMVMGAYPLIFFALGPLVYVYLILSNLKKGYREYAANKLVVPTHIGLTDSGFKLYWRGGYFYNYPSLAIWPEVYKIDLVYDQVHQSPTLKFLYQTGFGRLNLWLPLSGFATSSDMKLLLSYFAQFVPMDNQGHALKQMSEKDFAPLVEAFDNKALPMLETMFQEQPELGNSSDDELTSSEVALPSQGGASTGNNCADATTHREAEGMHADTDCVDPPDEGGTLDIRSKHNLGS